MPLQLTAIYNVGSIILGLIAWTFADLAIAKHNHAQRFTTISFSACCLSLVLQLLEVSNRVNLGDYAAIEDTIRAVLFAAVILVVVTVVLNVVALVKSSRTEIYEAKQ